MVYIIRYEDANKIYYASQDANDAIAKSIMLIEDQHQHVLEVWLKDKRLGSINLVL